MTTSTNPYTTLQCPAALLEQNGELFETWRTAMERYYDTLVAENADFIKELAETDMEDSIRRACLSAIHLIQLMIKAHPANIEQLLRMPADAMLLKMKQMLKDMNSRQTG